MVSFRNATHIVWKTGVIPHMKIQQVFATIPICCLLFLAGCGPVGRPPVSGLVTVSGIVSLDDKPLANASVTFVPMAGGSGQEVAAGGMTDSTGKYVLRTEGDSSGVRPGRYKVIISSIVMPDGSVRQIDADNSPMSLMTQGGKEVVPAKYSDLIGSTLSSNVDAAGGTIDFKLSSS